MNRIELEKKYLEVKSLKIQSLTVSNYERAAYLRDCERIIYEILDSEEFKNAEHQLVALNRQRQIENILGDKNLKEIKIEEIYPDCDLETKINYYVRKK